MSAPASGLPVGRTTSMAPRRKRGTQVAACVHEGCRGLPRGLSLNKLLVKHRGKSVKSQRPVLKIRQILAWADAHHERTGHWPTSRSGPIADTKDETWQGVAACLYAGNRGLRRGISLRNLLVKYRGAASSREHVRFLRSRRSWSGPMSTTSGLASGLGCTRVVFPGSG